MDVLETLQLDFIQSFERRNIQWLANIATADVYDNNLFTKKLVTPKVEDFEAKLSEFYAQFPEHTVVIGPALGGDSMPSGLRNFVGIYATIEGFRSQHHRKYLESLQNEQLPNQQD